MTGDELEVGARYRLLRDLPSGAARTGEQLELAERIYNREDGSWLFRLTGGGRDVWLVEANPVDLPVLRQMDAYFERDER